MSINELNGKVKALLDKKIFWTGFKTDINSPDLFSQIGWFGNNGYIQFGMGIGEAGIADPQVIARKIESAWTERMNQEPVESRFLIEKA